MPARPSTHRHYSSTTWPGHPAFRSAQRRHCPRRAVRVTRDGWNRTWRKRSVRTLDSSLGTPNGEAGRIHVAPIRSGWPVEPIHRRSRVHGSRICVPAFRGRASVLLPFDLVGNRPCRFRYGRRQDMSHRVKGICAIDPCNDALGGLRLRLRLFTRLLIGARVRASRARRGNEPDLSVSSQRRKA